MEIQHGFVFRWSSVVFCSFILLMTEMSGEKTEMSDKLYDVRLVGGSHRCKGRLEVQHDGEWRPVSDRHSWSLKEAAVVCRQLGCGTAVSTRKTFNSTGPQPTWHFYSDCDGSERALTHCGTVKKWRSSFFTKVTCSDILFQPDITLAIGENGDLTQLLWGYSFAISCSVEPQYNGGNFSLVFTGLNQTRIRSKPATHHAARFTFPAADMTHQGNYSCIYYKFVFNHSFSSESRSLSLTVEDYSDVMLDDGVLHDNEYMACAGKLLVMNMSVVRPLSAESTSWDLKHASVVCRQLGCGSAVSTKAIHLVNTTSAWRFFSDCDGSESALMDCGDVQPWVSSSAVWLDCTGHQNAAGRNRGRRWDVM